MSIVDSEDIKSFIEIPIEESKFNDSKGYIAFKTGDQKVDFRTIYINKIVKVISNSRGSSKEPIATYIEYSIEQSFTEKVSFFKKLLGHKDRNYKEIVKVKPSYYSEDFYSMYYPSGVLSYEEVQETKEKALIFLKENGI